MINIDQSPIGRTPRSNPATYTGVFDLIRDLFAGTPDAKARGYKKGRFSFNVKGDVAKHVQETNSENQVIFFRMFMFLRSVVESVTIVRLWKYAKRGKIIHDVLNMTVEEAVDFFENVPSIRRKMETLRDVGLSYIRLGQPSTELSGGRHRELNLRQNLANAVPEKRYIFWMNLRQGLVFADVHKLTEILRRLSGDGNTVIVIEHNLDVIKTADYIIDIELRREETAEELLWQVVLGRGHKESDSYTGKYIASILEK